MILCMFMFWVMDDLKIKEQHREKHHLLWQGLRFLDILDIKAAVFGVLEVKRSN